MRRKGDKTKYRLKMPEHFSIEVRYTKHSSAYCTSFFPGVTWKEPHTVQLEADSFFEVLRFFLFDLD